MGFLTDPDTGKRMTAERLIQRKAKEWTGAFGTLIQERAGAAGKGKDSLIIRTGADLQRFLKAPRGRRR